MSLECLKICSENLPRLSTRVRVPAYSRTTLTSSIVHIGVGSFNRAHQAAYLDDLLHLTRIDKAAPQWAECGIGLLPVDERLATILCAQDFLYTLVERSAHGRQARIVGSICDFLHAPPNPQAAIERMAAEECRIVSMTITEGGYLVHPATGRLDDQHPDVLHDLQHPESPKTFLGFVTEALARRRDRGLAPFTVLSCDNLPGNGHTTQTFVSGFAEMKDPGLRAWIEANVAFPNSMVDRITPATTDVERALIGERFSIEDGWPVFTEPYRQWVLEDTFCNGRPPLDLVGVQFTSDVQPFEVMKVLLLNGSHFALSYPAALLGFEFVHDVIADDLLRSS
ncbi:MAG TPA: mannitol dehydrogenase family protein, partial [Acidobacteriaceae bacterium]